MKKIKNILLLALALLTAGVQGLEAQTAQLPAYSATAVLNQYIAENAGKYPAWQRDIVIEQGNVSDVSRRVIPPRRVGVSPVAGIYSYRPVTWDELEKADKLAILRDPKLLTWVSWYKSKGSLTIPKEIGTPLANNMRPNTTNTKNTTIANTNNMPTNPAVIGNRQINIPPIEQTPYYAEISQRNLQAQVEQEKRALDAQNRYRAYMQELQNLSQLARNTPNTVPNIMPNTAQNTYSGPMITMQPMEQQMIPNNYAVSQATVPQQNYLPVYMPMYNVGQSVPVMPIAPIAPTAPVMQSDFSAVYPEYNEILKLREDLLRDNAYVPENKSSVDATTPSLKLTPVVPVTPDMGKYQIKVNTGDLYSEDPLYYQLKASQ